MWGEKEPRTDGLDGPDRATNNLPPNGTLGLVRLALIIFSIIPNSAAVERIFSHFGIVHSKLRNRLSPDKVRKTILIKADVAEQYGVPNTRKRRFGDVEEEDNDNDGDDNDNDNGLRESSATSRPASTAASALAASSNNSDDVSSSSYLPIPHSHPFRPIAADLIDSTDQAEAELRDSDAAPLPSNSTTLAELFNYPSSSNSASLVTLTDFWRYGETGLENEVIYHDFTYVDSSETPI